MKRNDLAISAVVCGCGLLTAGMAGCEDAAARERQAVQVQLRDAGRQFQLLQAESAGSSTDELARKFNTLASEVGQINGGESGQQAAKSMLSAAALREAAAIQLDTAEVLERQHSRQREVLTGHINAVLRMRSVAEGLSTVDGAAERAQLQSELEQTRAAMEQYRGQVEQLDAPIAEQSAANTASQQKIEELRLQVGELLRRAQELGYADGLEYYKQATQTKREIDRIEFDMAQREIQLDYELTPELVMADTMANHLQELITAVETSIAQLNEFAQNTQTEAATTQAKAESLATEIRNGLQELSTAIESQLNVKYEEAQAALEKAASQVQSGMRSVSGEDAQAARINALHVQQKLARLHWTRMRGIDDHLTLLQRAKSAGVAGDGAEAAIQALTTARDQAMEQAKTAMASAQELGAQIQTRSNPAVAEALNRQLETAMLAIENKPAPAPRAGDMTSSSTSTSADAITSAPPKGAESPEALVAMIRTIDGIEDIHIVFELVAPADQIPGIKPGEKAFLDAFRSLAIGMNSLDIALQEKFGRGLAETGGGFEQMAAGAQLPDLSGVALENADDQQGSVRMPQPQGGHRSVEIRKINGRWYIDPKALGMDGMAGAPGAAPDPQMQQMAQMFGNMGKIFHELAAAVRNGQYDSVESFEADAEAKFQQIMQGSLMGGMMPPQQ